MFANFWRYPPKSYDSAAHLITLSKALPIEASKPSTALHSIAFLPSLNEGNWLQPKLTTSTIGPLHIEIRRHERTRVSIRLRNCTADDCVLVLCLKQCIHYNPLYVLFWCNIPYAYFVGMYSLQWTLLTILYLGAMYSFAVPWCILLLCKLCTTINELHRLSYCDGYTVFWWTVLWIQCGVQVYFLLIDRREFASNSILYNGEI